MSSIHKWLESYPTRLAVLSAAVAATSGFVFPRVLIPANMDFLGPIGSVLTIIVFLIAWVMRRELWRFRKSVFVVTGTLCLGALLILVNLNRKYVVTAELPEPRNFLIGSELTPWGEEKRAKARTISDKTYIEAIGEEAIPKAWGESFESNSEWYTASYLALGAGMLLMIAVAMAPPTPIAPRRGETTNVR